MCKSLRHGGIQKKPRGDSSQRPKAGGRLREGESSVVSPERLAGDGRIMTEGGGHSTYDDPSLDLAAGKSGRKWVLLQANTVGYPAACPPSLLPAGAISVPNTLESPLQEHKHTLHGASPSRWPSHILTVGKGD